MRYQEKFHWAICARCDGHGTHLTPSIGQHAYSREEFEEEFDEEERVEYFKRGGIYDVSCEACGGTGKVQVFEGPTWDDVVRYFEDDGERCGDCAFAKSCSQSHPYGSTTATETWVECRLLEGAGDPPDCPGMKEKWEPKEAME